MSGDSPTPALRAADADRERVVQALSAHAAAGRLTVEELDERTHAAYGARTLPELDTLLADLPDTVPAAPSREEEDVRDSFREHLTTFVLVNLLLVGIWAATGAGFFWPVFPLLGWGIAVGLDYAGTQRDLRRLTATTDPDERAAIVARNEHRRSRHGHGHPHAPLPAPPHGPRRG